MKYALTLLAFLLSLAIPASGQANVYLTSANFKSCAPAAPTGVPASSIQINSFSFGGVDATTANGAPGLPTLQNLTIAKLFDNCSGTLVTDFLTSAYISQMTLSSYPPVNGISVPKAALTITFSGVMLTKYTLNSASEATGSEQISFTFTKACIATATTSFCYVPSSNTVNER